MSSFISRRLTSADFCVAHPRRRHATHRRSRAAYASGGSCPKANGNLASATQYDANNQAVLGKGRIATVTSFNMPSVIYNDATSNVKLELSQYGPEHQRLKSVVTSAAETRSTIYLNPDNSGSLFYEKETRTTASTVEQRHYLTAYGMTVALVKQTSDGKLTTTVTRYFHRDPLNSPTAITDDAGAVVERLGYEPYGNRRFANGTTDPNNTIVALTTPRGFTNHEHFDELDLIHMNGRIYDPVIGRFLSPDPYLQAPGNLQSYNRYTYCYDNPLVCTDPSGYFSLRKLFRAVVIIAVAYYTGAWAASSYENYAASTLLNGGTPWAIGGSISTTSGIIGGAVGGFSAGFVGSNGDLQAGLKGGLSGAVFGGINGYYQDPSSFQQITANALASGTLSRAYGGSFREGLLDSLRSALAVQGFNYARNITDGLKLRSCGSAPGISLCAQNRWGELLTDGARNVECSGGKCWGDNWLTSSGMGQEGRGLFDAATNPNGHYYSENSYLGRFINQVSKVHDFFNSVGYDGSTGAWISRGEVYDSLFQIGSFAGMVPAALFTGYATVVSQNPLLLRTDR